MMAYESMSYWDVYKLPIPFRKWLIHRYNKHVRDKEGQKTPDNEPLPQSERIKMINNAQQTSSNSRQLSQQFLQPTRNKG